jgi:hypothetical protein
VEAIDKKGFVNEGYWLVVIFPAKRALLGVRVADRLRKGFERVEYGPLPITYAGHESGVIIANTVTAVYKFPSIVAAAKDRANWGWSPDVNDVFFFREPVDRLLDVYINIEPNLLRHFIHFPSDQIQTRYLASQTITANPDIHPDFGYFRNRINVISFPTIDMNFKTVNHTNVDLRTYCWFDVEAYTIAKADKETIKEAVKNDKAKIITLPYFTTAPKVEEAILNVYKDKLEIELIPLKEVFGL